MTTLTRAVLSMVLAFSPAIPAWAWPDRPLRFYIGFQAGGASDIVARIFADKLRPQLSNVQIVIDNRAGQGGLPAIEAFAAAKDDHSMLMYPDDWITARLVLKDQRFRPLGDFKPIGTIASSTLVLLAPARAPFADFGAFVKWAQAQPAGVPYVSPGRGTQHHVAAEFLSSTLKLNLRHNPVRGGGGGVNELVDGQAAVGMLGLAPTLKRIQAGEFRALAVTSERRLPELPNVPTLVELGYPQAVVVQRFGWVAPKEMADANVERLGKAAVVALGDDLLRRRLAEVGFVPDPSTPADYLAKEQAEAARWSRLIEQGLKVD